MTVEHFRFMDLPAELRLMVYEFIPVTTRHCIAHGVQVLLTKAMLVTKSLSCSILLASHAVYNEARPVLAVKLEILRTEPTRFLLCPGATYLFIHFLDILGRDGPIKNKTILSQLEKYYKIDVNQTRRFLDKASSLLSRSTPPGCGPNIAIVVEPRLLAGHYLAREISNLIEAIDGYCEIKFHGKGSLNIFISTGHGTGVPDDFPSFNHFEDWCGEELEVVTQAGVLEDQEWAESWQEDENI